MNGVVAAALQEVECLSVCFAEAKTRLSAFLFPPFTASLVWFGFMTSPA